MRLPKQVRSILTRMGAFSTRLPVPGWFLHCKHLRETKEIKLNLLISCYSNKENIAEVLKTPLGVHFWSCNYFSPSVCDQNMESYLHLFVKRPKPPDILLSLLTPEAVLLKNTLPIASGCQGSANGNSLFISPGSFLKWSVYPPVWKNLEMRIKNVDLWVPSD